MDRRAFLQTAVKASLAGIVTILLPIRFQSEARAAMRATGQAVTLASRRFKGTAQGRVLESLDGGKSWRSIANFGQDHPVLKVFQDGDYLIAKVGFLSHTFYLKSLDGKAWYTVDWDLA